MERAHGDQVPAQQVVVVNLDKLSCLERASSMISCANSLKMDKFVGAGGIRYKGRNCAVAVVVVVILLWSCSVLPAAWAQDPAGL